MPTKIIKGKYWDKPLNPIEVKGGGWHCTKTSIGCLRCWAEQQNLRFGNKLPYDNRPVEFVLNEKILQQPLRRKIPTTYFVCNLCDLFHEKVPFEFIDKVMETIFNTIHDHTYLILTKRIKQMAKYFAQERWDYTLSKKNVHLGVSISTPDEIWKIEELAKIPAVKFVSFEPLLADLGDIMPYLVSLDWVIIGCESIQGRVGRFREGFTDAAINLVRQCKAAGVPVFVKQIPLNGKVSKNMAEWPIELRVQEMIK